MRVECPNCGAKGEIDESKRPAGATSIRCPRCRQSIPLDLTASTGRSAARVSETGMMPDGKAASPIQSGAEDHASAGNESSPDSRIPPSSGMDPEPVVKSRCEMCGNEFLREDMARFGPSLVCADCKPMYVQMIEQGASRPGEMRYAGFWPRFGAKLVDGLVLFVINMCISFLLGIVTAGRQSDPASLIALKSVELLIETAMGVAMVTYFLGKFGATPGKMALGLEVVTPEGGRISYMRAFGRYFAEMLSSICLGIGYLLVIFDDERRAMHDRICNTRVVYK